MKKEMFSCSEHPSNTILSITVSKCGKAVLNILNKWLGWTSKI